MIHSAGWQTLNYGSSPVMALQTRRDQDRPAQAREAVQCS
jgi:hypothetical protein